MKDVIASPQTVAINTSCFLFNTISFPDIPEGYLYVFNIERTVRGHADADPDMIRRTVLNVLHRFFQQVDNAILSTCEVDDNKQMARKRLFDRWLRQANDGSILIRDCKVDTGAGMTWATMYFHCQNMFCKQLIDNFTLLAGENFYM